MKIFVSYRRDDCQAIAGRIYDHLEAHFGPKSVFFDIESVPGGASFHDLIVKTIAKTDALVALVGPEWLRDHNPAKQDWVVLEIETALKRQIPVVPILVDGARMPSRADLSPGIAEIAGLSAVQLTSGKDFAKHILDVVTALRDAAHGKF